MFGWLKDVFVKPASSTLTRKVDVGQVEVSILESEGTDHRLVFTGTYEGLHPMTDDDWVFDADFHFRAWQARAGEHGMLWIGRDTYVPLCNVKRVTVIARREYLVTVKG